MTINRRTFGNVEVSEDEVTLKGAKVRITMMVDYDILRSYKALAEERGAKYQTLMNKTLREGLAHGEQEEALVKRVARLERQVFRGAKKKAI